MGSTGQKTMNLTALGLTARGGAEAVVTGLAVDSREVTDGTLFFALPGSRVHGGEFIQYALRMGATAVLTDAEGARIAADELAGSNAALILSEDPRQALAQTASLWFGAHPETVVASQAPTARPRSAVFAARSGSR